MAYDNKDLFDKIPGRVQAAMDYIQHCMWLTDPISLCDFGNKGRALTAPEQATYLAALETTRLYFAGEMDYASPVKTKAGDASGEVAPCAECGKKKKCKC